MLRVSAPNKLLCYDVVVDNLIKTEIKNKNSKQSQIPQIYSGPKLLAPTSTIQDTTWDFYYILYQNITELFYKGS